MHHYQKSYPHGISDGTTNTIFLVEGFAYCGTNSGLDIPTRDPRYRSARLSEYSQQLWPDTRPTFADGGAIFRGYNRNDVHPITTSTTTLPSRVGVTFQIRPNVADCDGSYP